MKKWRAKADMEPSLCGRTLSEIEKFTAGQLYDMRQEANMQAEAQAKLMYPDNQTKERLAYILQESDRLYYAMTHP